MNSNASPVTVPIEGVTKMQVTATMCHMCPFVEEEDHGQAIIVWHGNGWTFELHQLRAYLNTFAERFMSHEDLTREVWAELSGHVGITNVCVTTGWDTAGMSVKCFI